MKRTTTILVSIFALLLWTASVSAQNNGHAKGDNDWHNKWKAEKIAYLTDAVGLTSSEAEKFWPVYNKAETEKRASMQSVFSAYKALEDAIKAGKGDSEVETLLNAYIKALDEGKGIDSKYVEEYRKILPVEKVAKLYISEESFRRQQIHKLNKDGSKRGPR